MEGSEGSSAQPLEELYVRYAPGGFRLAYLLTGDRQAAEDLVHDAFVRVVGRLGHIRTGIAFDAYLRKTIVNLMKNRWRHASVVRGYQEREAPPSEAIPSAEVVIVERDAVWHAILRLPVQQRTAIVLRFYEDLSEDDIASVLRCRPGTARSLVSRGMASLRQELERSVDA
jgi:RNA polymerase sigma-70 factor (sigma-E family)